MTSLTLFFIVEPPNYQYMACYLAASIRKHLPAAVEMVGYCPEHRLGYLDPSVIETLRRMRCDLRSFVAEGRFDPPYPHGNKILAALEPRTTEFSGFVDSDVLLIRDNRIENLVREGHVSASVAASMRWGSQDVWAQIYGAVGMQVPEERVTLMRDKRVPSVPYYSSGFVLFPEGPATAGGPRFAEVWMQTAQAIDAIEGLEARRPYLDQMSLPLAIRRAGLDWNELPEEQHFILGGQLRGKPFPKEREIYTVHYRKWDVLAENDLAAHGYSALRDQVGTRRVSWIWKQPLPDWIAAEPADGTLAAQLLAGRARPAPEPLPPSEAPAPAPETAAETAPDAAPAPAAPAKAAAGPDPSKAGMCAVTMVNGDHFFLERWLRYYGQQLGRENLYVLRHGTDPEIDRMASGANIVHLPDPEDKSGFDRRRWQALSNYASGLTLYYNWVLCGDVDEIVAVDPAVESSLADYLNAKFAAGRPPRLISPFALELVHTPASEPEPITPEGNILAVRRNFRLNSNYSKPCITRARVSFSVGGHGSASEHVQLDPHLFLFHLRYVDDAISRRRLAQRASWMADKNGLPEATGRKKASWDQGEESFDLLSRLTPVAETVDFPDFRAEMIAGRSQAASTGNWFFKNMRSKELYRLPERFAALF